MSIQHCFECDREIDTDFDAEHFEDCGEDQEDQKNWMDEFEFALDMHEANMPEYQQ